MSPERRAGRRGPFVAAAIAVVVIAAVGDYAVWPRRAGLPATSSAEYEQTTQAFYRGLAELQIGLLDGARQDFAKAATLAPGEPAIWANLGLAELRLGDVDLAATSIERAEALAPTDTRIAFLRGRLETTRGRADEGMAQFRRAITLDPLNLRARTALAQAFENSGRPDGDTDAQRVIDELAALEPGNLAVLIERARLAAKRGDAGALRDALQRMDSEAEAWPSDVAGQYRAARTAAQAADFSAAARALAFLRNMLVQVPQYLDDRGLVTPSAALIAEPFTGFERLPTPVSTPSAVDSALTFSRQDLGEAQVAPPAAVVAFSPDGEQRPVVFAADARGLYRADAPGDLLPWAGEPIGPHGLVALDWNNDFRMDLLVAGARGVRLFVQSASGAFTDDTDRASAKSGPITVDATGAWAADIDMDGDLDVIVGVRGAAPIVLRNDGDGTWTVIRPFDGVTDLRAFAWGDVDGDGTPDAVCLDGRGELEVFSNLQAGQFRLVPGPGGRAALDALAIGDVDRDGTLDVVTLSEAGAIRRAWFDGRAWQVDQVAVWRDAPQGLAVGAARLFIADLDNNGALDSGGVGGREERGLAGRARSDVASARRGREHRRARDHRRYRRRPARPGRRRRRDGWRPSWGGARAATTIK